MRRRNWFAALAAVVVCALALGPVRGAGRGGRGDPDDHGGRRRRGCGGGRQLHLHRGRLGFGRDADGHRLLAGHRAEHGHLRPLDARRQRGRHLHGRRRQRGHLLGHRHLRRRRQLRRRRGFGHDRHASARPRRSTMVGDDASGVVAGGSFTFTATVSGWSRDADGHRHLVGQRTEHGHLRPLDARRQRGRHLHGRRRQRGHLLGHRHLRR